MSHATNLATKPKPVLPKPHIPKTINVSRIEQAASSLIAILVTLGILVVLMFFTWLAGRARFETPTLPVEVVEGLGEGGGGGGSGTAPGPEQMLEEVSSDEVPSLQEHSVAEIGVEAITAAVSAVQPADIENLEEVAEGGGGIGGGSGGGIGRGVGTGIGDGRGPGRGGKPGGPLPDWEVQFNASTIEVYAQQLDFFNIELAAIGGGKRTVDYASKFTLPKPVVRSGTGAQEKRRYLTWRKGPLAAADKQLLAKAGIETAGRLVIQFLPFDVEQQMAQLELQFAKGKKMSQIRRTVFAVRGSQGKFEFYVVEQDLR